MTERITEDILEKALRGDMAPLKAIPKTDLHAHLLLSAPPLLYRELGGPAFPAPPDRFAGLTGFLQHLRDHYFPLFTSIDVYRKLTRATLEHMIGDGIVYTELSFDIAMPLLLGMTWDNLAQELAPEIERVSDRIAVLPELGLAREVQHPEIERLIDEALATGFFRSVDLYGDELSRPIDDFAGFFDRARAAGAKIKIHSGETGDASRVRAEVASVKPDGVQHGVRASEDVSIMAELAKKGIEINVCPHSNWSLRVVDAYEDHPLPRMLRAGMRVTLNTDDYSVFGRTLSEEYLALYRSGILDADELESIRLNGLSAKSSHRRP